MRENFEACLSLVLQYEGGYVDHPADPGGATNLGITRATLSAWRKRQVSKDEVRALTKQAAGDIYRANYWNAIGGDGLARGVDLATFDPAVNSGPARAKKWLLASIGGSDADTIKSICAKRLSFLHGLTNWAAFGKGWGPRVARVEATALRMALGVAATVVIQNEAAASKQASANAQKQATQAGTGTAATTGAGIAATGDHTTMIVVLVIGGVAFLAIVGVLVYRAWRQSQRAEILASAA